MPSSTTDAVALACIGGEARASSPSSATLVGSSIRQVACTCRGSSGRVATTVGELHTVLFGFSETSGDIANVETTMLGDGRVTQAHIDADATSIDRLAG